MNSETGIAGAERGVNIVIDQLPVWRAPHFIGAEPRWMTVISSGLCLVPGGALAYLAALASAIPAAVVVPLAIASALALLALWFERSPVHYVADARGVYFPSPRKLPMTGRGQARRWLFVPWSNIARIGVQPLLDESERNGVTFCLCVSDAERRLYFPRAAALDPGRESRNRTECSILAGYPGAFNSPYRIVSILRALQRQPAEDNARIDLTMLGVR